MARSSLPPECAERIPSRLPGRPDIPAGAAVLGALAAAALILGTTAFAGPGEGAAPRLLDHSKEGGIPAFSRIYGTSCTTCHVTPGKLNAEGESFRLNGYRFPVDDEDRRADDPVPLGAEPWKDLWPQAIWPGELPGGLPVAIHLANDLRVGRQGPDGRTAVTYYFPEALHLLAGTTLGGGIGVLADVGWDRDHGVRLVQAKVKVQDVLPWLPDRAANLWVGAQRPHLLTFGEPSLDRAARQPFLWQELHLADWEPPPEEGEALVSDVRFRPGDARPAIELNGVVVGRLHYGIGAAQPLSSEGGSGSRVSDIYGKVRYKLGGLGLDGRVPEGYEPEAWGGQLLDQGLVLESFAYFGETEFEEGVADRHRTYGLAVRTFYGRGEMGLGHVWGRNTRPWGVQEPGARRSSTFARAGYLFYPWLMGTAKADRIHFRALAGSGESGDRPPLRRARVLPGLVVLIRANVRAIAEGELFLRDRPPSGPGGERPHALWLRLDVAF